MAALLTDHLPIIAVSTVSGNQEKIQHYLENAGETFLNGTPVALDANGNTTAWGGSDVTQSIIGISILQALNLASDGKGASPTFGSVGFPGGFPTVGSVQNQPSAVNLPHGAEFADGTTTVQLAVLDTIFEAQVDASSGAVYDPTIALVGTQRGLTIDATGHWYVDLAKSTPGTNTVLTVVSLNPQDFVAGSTTTGINNGRVRFIFLQSVSQAAQ